MITIIREQNDSKAIIRALLDNMLQVEELIAAAKKDFPKAKPAEFDLVTFADDTVGFFIRDHEIPEGYDYVKYFPS